MDLNSSIDRQLIYIAKQGLMEPVPEPWEARRDENDLILYYNSKTGEETHQHPCDEGYRSLFEQERAKLIKERHGLEVADESANAPGPGDKSVITTTDG